MAKTNTPFLSLDARGSVGESITAQKSSGTTLLRKKPLPTDPYSLAQAYQRWLYEDYAYLWTQQSGIVTAWYRSAGVRFHLTGFQYWMKVMLSTMPDIMGWWRLDEPGGAVAHDSSKYQSDGAIFGAAPQKGVIDFAYYFDGINDRMTFGNPAQLQYNSQRSFVCFFNAPAFTGTIRQLSYSGYDAAPFGGRVILLAGSNDLNVWLKSPGAVVGAIQEPFTPDTWHCLVYTWDGVKIVGYVDGVTTWAPAAFAGPLACTGPLVFGRSPINNFWFKGYLDNVIYYNRVLTLTEIQRWSARRYPPQ